MKSNLLASVALVAFGLSHAVMAADAPIRTPVKAQPAPLQYDWSGPYVGFHFGYGGGSFGPGTNPLPSQGVLFPHSITGLVGGYQAGYNFQYPNGLVIGLEADVTFTSPLDRPALTPAPFNTTFNYLATARARVGHAFGSVLPYVTAGAAWGQTQVIINDADGAPVSSKSLDHVGWTGGIGIEYALAGNWSGRLEYNYIDLAPRTYGLDIAAQPRLTVRSQRPLSPSSASTTNSGTCRKVIARASRPRHRNRTTGASTDRRPSCRRSIPASARPMKEPNSLPGKSQGRETWTTTAFIGRRLWDGGEVYLNPELAQGFGLASTLGLAGFSNGEAQKAGAPFPKIRAQRYFFRQTFGLGGEQETVEDGPNQLAGKRDIDRITLTVGRIAIGDIFDANSYAHDPRADFMNWAIWSAAAMIFRPTCRASRAARWWS